MIGKKFGYWTILEKVILPRAKKGEGRQNASRCSHYICRCECGTVRQVSWKVLSNEKKPRSCGCSRKELSDRLFEKNFTRGNKEDCWEWQRTLNTGGYGKYKSRAASRIMYEKTFGRVPAHLQVCHTCDNRKCVNPSHMFLGTIADNMADKVAKGRQAIGSKVGSAKYTEELVYSVRKMRLSQIPYDEIAQHFGISWDTVRMMCRGPGWKHVPLLEECRKIKQCRKVPKGSNHVCSKLDEEKIIQIKQLIKDKIGTNKIAIEFGVSPSTICDIKQGRTWSHV